MWPLPHSARSRKLNCVCRHPGVASDNYDDNWNSSFNIELALRSCVSRDSQNQTTGKALAASLPLYTLTDEITYVATSGALEMLNMPWKVEHLADFMYGPLLYIAEYGLQCTTNPLPRIDLYLHTRHTTWAQVVLSRIVSRAFPLSQYMTRFSRYSLTTKKNTHSICVHSEKTRTTMFSVHDKPVQLPAPFIF